MIDYADYNNPKPTMDLLLALHDCAMALNSLPGLDGQDCQNMCVAFRKVAQRMAPLGWLLPGYYSWNSDHLEHIPDVADCDVWGTFPDMVRSGLRPATELNLAGLAFGEIFQEIADHLEYCED